MDRIIGISCKQHPEYSPTGESFPIEEPQNDCNSCELFFFLSFSDDEVRLKNENFVNGLPKLDTLLNKLNEADLKKAVSGLRIDVR